MALKYLIEYLDVVDVTHRIEILDDNYFGSAIPVKGFATLSYSNSRNPLEAIRGSALRIDLEASVDLTFEDLYTEGQKTIKTLYYRAGELKFTGWINPEGWFEDYVNDNWIVGFDCIDGLGYLKDLAFVYSTGERIIEIMSIIELLALALKRTGLNQDIYVDIKVQYTGMTPGTDTVTQVKIDPNRYFKEDDTTISDCDEVIRSLLKIFPACLTTKNGVWYVYRPNSLVNATDRSYEVYNSNGIAQGSQVIEDINQTIGSDINNIPIHFVNENQSISVVNSIGAYRINYKYGLKISLLGNENLLSSGGVIDDWTIDTNENFSIPPDETGFDLRIIVSPSYLPILQLTSDIVLVAKDDILNFSFDTYKKWISGVPISHNSPFRVHLKIRLDASPNNYWLDDLGIWQESDTELNLPFFNNISFNDIIMPDSGDLWIEVWTPVNRYALVAEWDLHFSRIAITPSDDQFQGVLGEFHTFQRTSKPSAQVEPIREVLSGDGNSDIYIGVLRQFNEIDPTITWNREGSTEELAILQIMGDETLRLTPDPAKVFSGDIYGFIDFLSIITIDNIPGKWMVIAYSYNTKNNVIQLVLRQVFDTNVTDILYTKTFDYGKTVEPTIIG